MFRYTTEEFIKKSQQIHGDAFDYTETDCNVRDEKGRIHLKCKKCGSDLWVIIGNHLNGAKCRVCKYIEHAQKFSSNTEEFIKKAVKKHGNKYDYALVEYERKDKKVKIICHEKDENGVEHGIFEQTPNNHLTGYGCKKCAGIETLTKEKFINNANKVHNFKYDYSEVEYVNNRVKVKIICPKHGEFWQSPTLHIHLKEGCPKCNQSKLEIEISNILSKHGIEYIYQGRQSDNRLSWLGRLTLDFFLPEYNVAIECQGIEHFEPINFFGGQKKFEYNQDCDGRKKELCEKNGVTLIYFSSSKIIENRVINDLIFTDANKLIGWLENGKI